MRFFRHFFIIIFLLLGVSRTYAGILLEPYVGYAASVGGLEKQFADGSEIITDYGNWDLGARAGYVYDIFMAGIDFDWRMMKANYTLGNLEEMTATIYKPKVQTVNLGIFVGLWLKDNFNFRVSYLALSRWKFTDIPSDLVEYNVVNPGDVWSGNGFALATGWRVYDWVAVNFEFRYFSYGKFKDEKVSSEKKFKPKELLFTVSFPFHLGD